MNKILKGFFANIAAVTFVLASVGTNNVYAANKIGSYQLTGGVGDYGNYRRYYYVTSSASNYSTTISNAMSSWVNTSTTPGVTTSISWRETSTQSSSVMDIYYGSYYGSGIAAATTFWTYSTNINPTTSNWGWGKICLNGSTFANLTAFNRQGTTAHEMGHVFGLDETNSDTSSVMCQLGSGRTVNRASASDLRTINSIYG